MTKKTRVFVERQDPMLREMFRQEGFTCVSNIFEADFVCLDGGADVSPELYQEENTFSHNSPERDIYTAGLLAIAQDRDLPVVGICRGSQFMNVYHGMSMHQDIQGHAMGSNTHPLEVDGRIYQVCSAHHQAARWDEESSGFAEDWEFNHGQSEIFRSPDGHVEMVRYPDANMLAFQPHPEYHPPGHECRELFFNELEKIL